MLILGEVFRPAAEQRLQRDVRQRPARPADHDSCTREHGDRALRCRDLATIWREGRAG
jgi:hypothetical protein